MCLAQKANTDVASGLYRLELALPKRHKQHDNGKKNADDAVEAWGGLLRLIEMERTGMTCIARISPFLNKLRGPEATTDHKYLEGSLYESASGRLSGDRALVTPPRADAWRHVCP